MTQDPRDADWTAAELAHLDRHYPEFTATPNGRLVATITRREALSLQSAYPTMFQRAAPKARAPVDADEAVLAAKYPSMFRGKAK